MRNQIGCIVARNQLKTKKKKECVQQINLTSKGLEKYPQYQFLLEHTQYKDHNDAMELSKVQYLKLDNNNLIEIALNHKSIPIGHLSVNFNKLIKFTIKKSVTVELLTSLKSLNLTNNLLAFVDLGSLCSLQTLNCSQNKLETIILPSSITHINMSNNQFSNIQYSILSSKIFPKLKQINVCDNNLYDLILAINGTALLPHLTKLAICRNSISYVESLPSNLQILDLEQNCLVLDRSLVNKILSLNRLYQLNLCGNNCSNHFINILNEKSEGRVQIIYQSENKQSPYKIYPQFMHSNNRNKNSNHNKTFTLGEADSQFHNSFVDDIYNIPLHDQLQQQSQISLKLSPQQNKVINSIKIPQIHHIQNNINIDEINTGRFEMEEKQNHPKQNTNTPINSCNKDTIINTANQERTLSYKICPNNQQPITNQCNYKQYLKILFQHSLVPYKPFKHLNRQIISSQRIDQPTNPSITVNQFTLFNEMFSQRGGVHYVRKFHKFQQLPLPQHKVKSFQFLFLNRNISKKQFTTLCQGNYQIIDCKNIQKHQLLPLPSSFTCYHILLRLDNKLDAWKCGYCIETVHL